MVEVADDSSLVVGGKGLCGNLNGALTTPEYLDRKHVSLCFELRGRPNISLNLISDQCISVNTHYNGSRRFTYMDKISVLAVGRDGQCRKVMVDVNGCQATVDGREVSVYRESGKLHNRVYISVPNCHELPMVMWVTCTAEEGEDLLHFRVSRGGSLAPTTHGIIGEGLVTMVTLLKHTNWHKQQE